MSSEWVVDLDWSKYDTKRLQTYVQIYCTELETRRENYEGRNRGFDMHTDGFLQGMKQNLEREISRRLTI